AGLTEVEPSATREFFIEKSTTTFASIGGHEELKRLLDSVVERSHRADDLYEQIGLTPPRGVLFVVPSGTAKTAMARAVAGGQQGGGQVAVRGMDGAQRCWKWFGESEKALRDVFKKARRAAPCLLFFDNVDALAPRSGPDPSGAGVHQRMLSQLLREIDNLR